MGGRDCGRIEVAVGQWQPAALLPPVLVFIILQLVSMLQSKIEPLLKTPEVQELLKSGSNNNRHRSHNFNDSYCFGF